MVAMPKTTRTTKKKNVDSLSPLFHTTAPLTVKAAVPFMSILKHTFEKAHVYRTISPIDPFTDLPHPHKRIIMDYRGKYCFLSEEERSCQ